MPGTLSVLARPVVLLLYASTGAAGDDTAIDSSREEEGDLMLLNVNFLFKMP